MSKSVSRWNRFIERMEEKYIIRKLPACITIAGTKGSVVVYVKHPNGKFVVCFQDKREEPEDSEVDSVVAKYAD